MTWTSGARSARSAINSPARACAAAMNSNSASGRRGNKTAGCPRTLLIAFRRAGRFRLAAIRQLRRLFFEPRVVRLGPAGDVLVGVEDRAVAQGAWVLFVAEHREHSLAQLLHHRRKGRVAGEVALYDPLNGGTFIVGDALINFEPSGFTVLPRKYCLNQRQLRQSLWERLTRPAERMLFAHGTPILSGANAHLRRLLESDS